MKLNILLVQLDEKIWKLLQNNLSNVQLFLLDNQLTF